jgi:hypothetical protein
LTIRETKTSGSRTEDMHLPVNSGVQSFRPMGKSWPLDYKGRARLSVPLRPYKVPNQLSWNTLKIFIRPQWRPQVATVQRFTLGQSLSQARFSYHSLDLREERTNLVLGDSFRNLSWDTTDDTLRNVRVAPLVACSPSALVRDACF